VTIGTEQQEKLKEEEGKTNIKKQPSGLTLLLLLL
jgi:hypothetical protein